MFFVSTKIDTGGCGAGVGQFSTCTVPPNTVQLLQHGAEGVKVNADTQYASLCADLVDSKEVNPVIVCVTVDELAHVAEGLVSSTSCVVVYTDPSSLVPVSVLKNDQ